MFDTPDKLLLGLLTGLAFGVLLQKGQVTKFAVIVGQFLFQNWTVVKIMATAVVVGSVGVYALVGMGLTTLHIKPALIGGVVFGGILFGAGLALFGYCPGTGVAAAGEGHRDAAVGVVGMLAGASLYVALFPTLQPIVRGLADWGKITFPTLTGTSPWLWIGMLIVLAGTALRALERFRKPPAGHSQGTTLPVRG
jgi:uncharacterized protein